MQKSPFPIKSPLPDGERVRVRGKSWTSKSFNDIKRGIPLHHLTLFMWLKIL
jgi:hypothetical protein